MNESGAAVTVRVQGLTDGPSQVVVYADRVTVDGGVLRLFAGGRVVLEHPLSRVMELGLGSPGVGRPLAPPPPPVHHGWTPAQDDLLTSRHRRGESVDQLARAFGRSRAEVAARLSQLSVARGLR